MYLLIGIFFNMKVSVIMNCYNSDTYLKEAIDSTLNQTYKDFEYLIIDDCSTDETEKIIKNKFNDPRIKYIRNHKNIGQSYSILNVAKMFGKKIKYLPKRPGERYASALTNMNLSNKVYKNFGKIDLKKYIKNFIENSN